MAPATGTIELDAMSVGTSHKLSRSASISSTTSTTRAPSLVRRASLRRSDATQAVSATAVSKGSPVDSPEAASMSPSLSESMRMMRRASLLGPEMIPRPSTPAAGSQSLFAPNPQGLSPAANALLDRHAKECFTSFGGLAPMLTEMLGVELRAYVVQGGLLAHNSVAAPRSRRPQYRAAFAMDEAGFSPILHLRGAARQARRGASLLAGDVDFGRKHTSLLGALAEWQDVTLAQLRRDVHTFVAAHLDFAYRPDQSFLTARLFFEALATIQAAQPASRQELESLAAYAVMAQPGAPKDAESLSSVVAQLLPALPVYQF